MNARVSIKAVIIGIMILLITIFFYSISYGFIFPPCSKYEIPLEVSDSIRTSNIIFEKQMYYVISPKKDKKDFWPTCQNMRAEAFGFIKQNNEPYQGEGYEIIPIPLDTKFKLVRASMIGGRGLTDFEGYASGDYYLLKDNSGKEWYIREQYFKYFILQ